MNRTSSSRGSGSFLVALLILGAILGFLFRNSFNPSQVIFSNDGPLGTLQCESIRLPDAFSGNWTDLHWLGSDGGFSPACITYGLLWLLGPVGFAKFYDPAALLLLGLSAWIFFRTIGLSGALCTVGAIAAALNSNFFSNTAWGLGSRALTLACVFLALAALSAKHVGNRWMNAVLAGLATGMAVVEGADNGVIFSLFVAAFVLWQTWAECREPHPQSLSLPTGEGSRQPERGLQSASVSQGQSMVKRPEGRAPGQAGAAESSPSTLGEGEAKSAPWRRSVPWPIHAFVRLVLVAGFAGFIATQSLISLFSLAAKTSVTAQTDQQTKEEKWSFATQWSLPPAEMLRVIIPGLYGYRMDTPEGGNYWGRVGEAPGAPEQMRRYSGAGEYAGVLVVLLACWSLAASFARPHSQERGKPASAGGAFTDAERKMIWFWAIAFFVAMLLSWGRFAPMFYKVVYALPYFSSIRNPMKFMHAGHLALMVLFGYGLLGLSRKYLEATPMTTGSISEGIKGWWAKAKPYEKRWTYGMFAALAASLLAYLLYASGEKGLVAHLMKVGFPDTTAATQIAKFSIGEVGMFFLFFGASAAAVFLVMGGMFTGGRARWAAVLLGLILAIDLARASTPWIVYWNYQRKYATNSVIDALKEKPYESRVVAPPFLNEPRALPPEKRAAQYFPQIYGIEWVQHHFQFYNIQSIDVAQDPRPPADKKAYTAALLPKPGRYWELTNTRYILGLAGFLDALSTQFDKGRNRFRIAQRFDVAPKPGVINPSQLEDLTAVSSPDGALALFEFTGALPRAKLYSHWQVSTNDDAALKTLADEAFDPHATVLLADEIAAPPEATNAAPNTAEISKYSPRRIELRANATAASVLLLNDRYDADWRVSVDGQPAKLLRANFIMRGVQVPAGQHTVVFEFRPSLIGLKISLAAIGLGAVLCALLFFVRQKEAGQQAKAA